METKDWITLGGFVVLIAGWFIINILNRKNEIAKVRLKFRLKIMQSFLDCISEARKHVKVKSDGTHIINEEFKLNLITVLERLALFGTKEELDLCQSIFEELGKNKYHGNKVTELRDIVIKRQKRELSIDD